MSLYGPTFHVTPVDLFIIYHCNLYISSIMSCGNKIVSKLFQIVSKLFQIVSKLFTKLVNWVFCPSLTIQYVVKSCRILNCDE